MAWPWSRNRVEERSTFSISDPALAQWFGVGNPNLSGVSVGEGSSLGLSAFYRANNLIAGTIAGLPLRVMRTADDGTRQRVDSFLDDPGGPLGPTPYEWVETVLWHLLVHGNAFLAHVFNGAGGLAGLTPIHPLAVQIDQVPEVPGGRLYQASLADGTRRTFTVGEMTHVPSVSLDGVRGLSLISIARNSLGTGLAGDRAAARMFGAGATISGLVTADDDIDETEAKAIKEGLDAKLVGPENAGEIAVVNRRLKFTQWQMTNADAQWLESRQFQIEEISRWTGVPPHLLSQTEKQTSWGTGVAEQNRGLARFTLAPWTARLEQRLSRLLPTTRLAEFDFVGLEKPTPEQEIPLLIAQVDAGLMTVNEARKIRNMDPIAGGDALRPPHSTARVPARLYERSGGAGMTVTRFGVELRAQIKGNTLHGHAAVFGQMAEMPAGWEQLAPEAFDAVLADDTTDVRALRDHDPKLLLGRQSAGTLRIGVDSEGLPFEVDLPNTSYANDLRELVERGDLDGASFGFVPGQDAVTRAADGRQLRTHTSVAALIDVSAVTFPAYGGAGVALRHYDIAPRPRARSQLIRARHRALSL